MAATIERLSPGAQDAFRSIYMFHHALSSEHVLSCEDFSVSGGNGSLGQAGAAAGHDSADDGAESDGCGDDGFLVSEVLALLKEETYQD